MANKAGDITFNSGWSKTNAWASVQGFSPSAVSSVYALDLSHYQLGQTTMSAAQRAIAIQAAMNPNQVPSVPEDHPVGSLKPSNIYNNAVSDIGKIATGLMPTSLVKGLYHTIANTFDDVVHPGRLLHPQALQDTLLSFIPGVSDIGMIIEHGYKNGHFDLKAGLEGLSADPVMALLDALPLVTGKLAGDVLRETSAGAKMSEKVAAAGTMTEEQIAKASALKLAMKSAFATVTKDAPFGFDMNDVTKGVHRLNFEERIKNYRAVSRFSSAIKDVVGETVQGDRMYTGIYKGLMRPAMAKLQGLSEQEVAQFNDIFTLHRTGGPDGRVTSLNDILTDDAYTENVKDAVRTWQNGPLRFAREMAVASGKVTAIRRSDGTIAYVGVEDATNAVKLRAFQTHRAENTLIAMLALTDDYAAKVISNENVASKVAAGLTTARQAAQQVAAERGTENVIERYGTKFDQKDYLGTTTQAERAILGEGGIVDQLAKAVANVTAAKNARDFTPYETVIEQAKAALGYFDRYGYSSINKDADAAFQAVHHQIEAIKGWAEQGEKDRRRLTDQIIDPYNARDYPVPRGNPSLLGLTTKAKMDAFRSEMKFVHADEQEELKARYDDKILTKNNEEEHLTAQFRAHSDQAIADARNRAQLQIADYHVMHDLERRATRRSVLPVDFDQRPGLDVFDRTVRRKLATEIASIQRKTELRITKLHARTVKENALLRAAYKVEKKELTKAHKLETETAISPLKEAYKVYQRSQRKFQEASWATPNASERDLLTTLQQKYATNELVNAAHGNVAIAGYRGQVKMLAKIYGGRNGYTEDAMARVISDPHALWEMAQAMMEDVMNNPMDPALGQLGQIVEATAAAIKKSANDELNVLRVQDRVPIWLPATGSLDKMSFDVKASIGRGVPTPDVAYKRVFDKVNTRYDIVIGVTKAVKDELHLAATAELVEHTLMPRAISASEIESRFAQLQGSLSEEAFKKADLVGFGVGSENATRLARLTEKAAALGLTKFDSERLFGFSAPIWKNDAVFLPTKMVRALEKIQEESKQGYNGLFDKEMRLYKMSLLGLSPRYTMHVLFGGAMMLALRSSWRAFSPSLLKDAHKAMVDGTLPQQMYRVISDPGYSQLGRALNTMDYQAASEAATLAIQEETAHDLGIKIDFKDKKEVANLNPIHGLKALARMNMRFTSYVSNLYTSVAYLDYLQTATDSSVFKNAVTGEEIPMTYERAAHEAMHHVKEVFGDLDRMLPIERTMAKYVMPFYGWQSHILGYVLSYPFDHPMRAQILSHVAYENSASVPAGLPERIQTLFFFGKPDATGMQSAVDLRFMNPFRDVTNYASLTGWIQALNPIATAPLAVLNPESIYGSNTLYPTLTYSELYGIKVAGPQGSLANAVEQFVPQFSAAASAVDAATMYRNQLKSNPNGFYKQMFESLSIPFAQIQQVSKPQIAARSAIARYEVAKQDATTAFQTGDFSILSGYETVPDPLNAGVQVTPAQLQAIYNQALAQYPGQAPYDVVLPPPTPPGGAAVVPLTSRNSL